MKIQLIILACVSFAVIAYAATLTIDIPANDVPRVSEAFGSIYNLGRPANINEVSYFTRNWIIQSTQDYERRKNMAVFTPPPLEMQPSPTPTATAGMRAVEPAKVAAPTATPKGKK